MTARSGMANLITRLRTLANDRVVLRQDTATSTGGSVYWLNYKPVVSGTISVGGTIQGTAAYSLDTTNGRLAFVSAPTSGLAVTIEYSTCQFTDDEMEDLLDGCVTHVEDREIDWLSEQIAGGTTVYHRAALGYRDWEETTSGTIYWSLKDYSGSIISTANYTLDPIVGQVRFTADQGGTSYYVTGRSYDLYAAAADVWVRRQAIYSDWYQFSADGQSFQRQQAFQQAVQMEKQMRARAGQNRGRGDAQTGLFVRTDLNPRGDE